MAVPPPPQYPEYPYPPPNFAYGAPPPVRMPGLTTTAVVLLWVMVGLSTIGVLSTILTLVSPVMSGAVFDTLGSRGAMLLPIIASQGLAWPIVLPILIICFLSSARSRQWCDR